ncbi:MAG: hypothetical protein WD250_02395 [Egibacteraceae bacterium]
MATTTRRLFVVVLGVLAASMAAASVAFACANLTTLVFSSDTAEAGSTLDARMDRFRDGEGFSDIVMTFETRDGAVLWSGPAGEDRGADATITVPNVDPGHYAFVATQTDAEGKPVAGAPARASLEITGGGAAAVSAQEAPATAAVPASVEEAPAAAPAPEAVPAPATAPAQASTAPVETSAAPASTEAASSTQAAASSAPAAAPAQPATEQGAAASAATPAETTAATVAQPTAFDRFAAVERAAATSTAATLATVPAADVAAAQPAGASAAAQTALTEAPALASTLALWMLAGVAAFGLAVLATRRRGFGMAVARF